MEGWLIFCAVGIGVLILMGVFIMFQLDGLRRGMRERELPGRGQGVRAGGGSGGGHPSLEDRKKGLEDQRKLFKEFVREFPQVPQLPKKEQFERFRAWCREKGR